MDDKGLVCVTGGSGYVGSWLIKNLLERGYSVRAAVRSKPDGERDLSYLRNLPGASTRLEIHDADLNQPETFNSAVDGCTGVFHVAHTMEVAGEDSEEVAAKRSVEALLGILRACLKSRTVKRVVYTSSTAAVLYNEKVTGSVMVDEDTWSDIDICRKTSHVMSSSFNVSKTITERTALEFAEKHELSVVSVVLPLVLGPFITPHLPFATYIALNLIFGREDGFKYLSPQFAVHLDDAANAHIFLLELADAKGRYFCSSGKILAAEDYDYLSGKYPEFELPTKNEIKQKMTPFLLEISSKKLLDSGFKFQFGVEEMFDHSIQSCREKGFLP